VYVEANPYEAPYFPRWPPTVRPPYCRVMERAGSQADPRRAPDTVGADPPSVRDAAEILARAAADEAAADRARTCYRTRGMAPLDADARIGPLLAPDEAVVAVRHSAALDRRESGLRSGAPAALAGGLYLTSRRLVLVGRLTLSFGLDEIEDAVLSGERLLLVMRDGRGASLDVAQPRLFRVEIATARAFARG